MNKQIHGYITRLAITVTMTALILMAIFCHQDDTGRLQLSKVSLITLVTQCRLFFRMKVKQQCPSILNYIEKN